MPAPRRADARVGAGAHVLHDALASIETGELTYWFLPCHVGTTKNNVRGPGTCCGWLSTFPPPLPPTITGSGFTLEICSVKLGGAFTRARQSVLLGALIMQHAATILLDGRRTSFASTKHRPG